MDNMIIIPVLLSSDKIQLSTIVFNRAFCPIYFTISNLNYKTRKKYKKSSKFLLGLISIYKKNNIDIKLDIYYISLRIIT